MNKMTKIGAALACIAVILLIISLSMPWWTFHQKSTYGDETQEQTQRMTPMLLPQTSSSDQDTTNTSTTLNITTWLTTIGTISATIAVMLLGIAINSDRSKYRKIGAALLIAGLILAVVAPIYFMMELPNSYENDLYDDSELPDHDSPAKSFFGSYDQENREESWRGGIGWFLSFIAAAILGIGAVLALKSDRRSQYYQSPEPRQHFEERRSYEETEGQQYEGTRQQEQYEQPREEPPQPQNREPWKEPETQKDQSQYQEPGQKEKDEKMIEEPQNEKEWN